MLLRRLNRKHAVLASQKAFLQHKKSSPPLAAISTTSSSSPPSSQPPPPFSSPSPSRSPLACPKNRKSNKQNAYGMSPHKNWTARCFLHSDTSSPIPHGENVPGTLLDKILIANRGEIACRIIRTARRLGIQSVAVYSEADKDSLHVRMADEAVCIGPAPVTSSYLNAAAIVEAAKRVGAHAVHPGYGFLSENAQFAELCKQASITFIGPPINAIQVMGDKSESKSLMSAAGVPVVPGYHGETQDAEFLKLEADKIGYPVIIKATQGGGGKGMKIVSHPDDFLESLYSAQREALASFGNKRVLIEKYIAEPRHIEVQVFGDQHGNVVHLFERDCSVQRRHQKIIEEAPAPRITENFRRHIGQAAVNAAKAVGYYNAGTVEFIVDSLSEEFFFMEMNTRLQVEHPVTEMITNQDLVEWQIRIASGEPLPYDQNSLSVSGHAFEARIYAENIESGFLPAAGVLHHYHPPDLSPTVRVETGVRQGDEVTIHYDPMIAKLVVWGHNRSSALLKLQDCLSKFQISGIPTNISFLKTLAQHPAFSAGEVGTHFIEHYRGSLLAPLTHEQRSRNLKTGAAIAATCVCIKDRWRASQGSFDARNTADWSSLSGFRLNHEFKRQIVFDLRQEGTIELVVTYCRDGSYMVEMQDSEHTTFLVKSDCQPRNFNGVKLVVNGISHSISASFYRKDAVDHVDIWCDGKHHEFSVFKRFSVIQDLSDDLLGIQVEQRRPASIPAGSVVAPMAGRLTKVLVSNGAKVKKGDPLVILEAMKMEHVVRAPQDGCIEGLTLEAGQHVKDNTVLMLIKVSDMESSPL